jgi:hypothetical protein
MICASIPRQRSSSTKFFIVSLILGAKIQRFWAFQKIKGLFAEFFSPNRGLIHGK